MFARQFRFELLKLFARDRTYLGFVIFVCVELIILFLMQTREVQHMFHRAMYGLNFSHYFSGLTIAYYVITNTIFVLGSLYLALVSGDIVAKEVEDGSMRMVLSRPVSRLRILLLKYLACVVYTWTLTIFMVIAGLAMGIAVRGVGGLFVAAPWDHIFAFFEPKQALERYAWGTGILCLIMLTFSTLGFMFSCFEMKPATATILTLSVYIADSVLRAIPQFESIHPYLLTRNMAIWTQVFQQQLDWADILRSLGYLGGWDVAFFALAAFFFCRRDFKS